MQGLQRYVVVAMLLATGSVTAADHPLSFPESQPGESPEFINLAPLENQARPEFSSLVYEIHEPGARFIKVHFSEFRLPPGILVEVSDPGGDETWRYSEKTRDALTVDADRGDDGYSGFSAMSVTGDRALVRLVGNLSLYDPHQHAVVIDSWIASQPGDLNSKTRGQEISGTQTTCGQNERHDAVCYSNSHPAEVERSMPVAKLINSSGVECTAWRVGSGNSLFTAQHCVRDQSDLDGAEIWFNYERESCGGSSTSSPVKVTGQSLIASSQDLDYALFSVNDFGKIAGFGNLGLDTGVRLGEHIFIPQHGLGMPKQLAIESDRNDDGLCQVDDMDHNGYVVGSDIGYYCDTTSSSSGSPVISEDSGKVVALHHLGGCVNSGVKMSEIWSEVSDHFGGIKPDGDVEWTGGSGVGTNPDPDPDPDPDPEPEPEPEPNDPPLAEFTYFCSDMECSFNATPSSDPDGSIETYAWDFGDGKTGSGAIPEHRYSKEGSYLVRLTVTDDKGGTGETTQALDVFEPNVAPEARFSGSCTYTNCDFDASGSLDADGEVLSWTWSFGDGSTGSGVQVSHDFEDEGSYSVTLTVTDNDGEEDSRTSPYTVIAKNQAPQAVLDGQCIELTCEFSSAGSSDPDGEITDFRWRFGDGKEGSGQQVSHEYAEPGEYDIQLFVTDDDGETVYNSLRIAVTQANEPDTGETTPDPGTTSNESPTARFEFTCDALSCAFDAASSQDPDGEITQYQWIRQDTGETFGEGVTARYEFPATGSYLVKLKVTDNLGTYRTKSRTVHVEAAGAPPIANFNYQCDALNCTLQADSSQQSNGNALEFDWDFGDGNKGRGAVVAHKYSKPGQYEVTLKVTGSSNGSASQSQFVHIEPQPEIHLRVMAKGTREFSSAFLKWNGAGSETVAILRNGKEIDRAPNTGVYVDSTAKLASGRDQYQVCESDLANCSPRVGLLSAK